MARISACSRGPAAAARSRARVAAAAAGASAAGSIGAFRLGPSTNASPQGHMAQSGSSCRAWRNARSASGWLNP